jgi:sucrose-6-phosphate hydrolase SacC (GH32 family)
VARTLFSATIRASPYTETVNNVQLGPFELAGKEPWKLQIFIDTSVIEVFANGRACLTERAYPARKESLRIGLFARGGKLNSIDGGLADDADLPGPYDVLIA